MKWLRGISLILTLVSGLLILVFLTPASGWRAFDVATGSMKPAIAPGSLVITHQAPVRSLRVGQVVTYRNPAHPDQTITHRIVGLKPNGAVMNVATKGDANRIADPPFAAGRIVGRVDLTVPGLGAAATWLRSPLVALVVVIVPATIVIIGELGILWQLLSEAVEPARRRRWVDGLMRRPMVGAGLVVLCMLALGSTVGVTWAALTTQASLTGNHIGIAVSTPTPTLKPTTSPTPAATPAPTPSPTSNSDDECNITIQNTAPGSVNQVTCTRQSSVQANAGTTSISVTSSSTSTSSVGVSHP
jgi:signal peptidase I